MSRSIQRGMAIALVAAPVLALFVLFFGGEQISGGGCGVGPAVCPPRPSIPGPIPIIGTNVGAIAALALLAAAWVASIVTLLVLAVRRDRAASGKWAVRIGVAVFVAGGLGFAYGYVGGGRLLTGAETAVAASATVGFALVVTALVASLRWADRDRTRKPA